MIEPTRTRFDPKIIPLHFRLIRSLGQFVSLRVRRNETAANVTTPYRLRASTILVYKYFKKINKTGSFIAILVQVVSRDSRKTSRSPSANHLIVLLIFFICQAIDRLYNEKRGDACELIIGFLNVRHVHAVKILRNAETHFRILHSRQVSTTWRKIAGTYRVEIRYREEDKLT